MKQIINDFINSIDTKVYNKIRASMGDAECRRYLKERLQKQLTIHSDVERSEQLKCDNHRADLEHFMNYSESICKTCKQKV